MKAVEVFAMALKFFKQNCLEVLEKAAMYYILVISCQSCCSLISQSSYFISNNATILIVLETHKFAKFMFNFSYKIENYLILDLKMRYF